MLTRSRFQKPPSLGIAFDSDVERRTQLDSPRHPGRSGRLVCGVDRICDILRPLDLRAQEVKERFGLSIDTAGQLDLFHHLIGRMVQLLFRRDDAEQVDDKGQQDNSDEDKHHCGEVVGLTPLIF